MAKDKKIQVLLTSDDEQKLNRIITSVSMHSGKLIATSTYVRDLILHHIANYEGEQTSFVQQEVKKLLAEHKKLTNSKNIK
tara:strand:+ start:364 stop:606 length:243 start_codon:yes stop_codon:yes gene_type:complete